MSTSVVPIFDPQGKLRDVPQEQMVAAVKSGGMPSVRFQAPDGKTRFVPANRIQDAVKAGGKILPMEDQDVQHPGFWSTLIDDAKGLGKSLLNAGPEIGTGDQIHQNAEYLQKLKDEGHSFPYRALMSLTPNGMRESAESGDMGGVAGHSAVPVAAALSPLAAEGASRVAGSVGNAAKGAANSVRPAASSALRTVSDVVSPDVTGILSPRLANAQRLAGKLADALAQKPVYPGAPLPEHPGVFPGAHLPEHPGVFPGAPLPEHPGVFPGAPYPDNPGVFPGAPLPATPSKGLLQASSLARGPQAVVDPAAGLGSIPVSKSALQQAVVEMGTKTPMPTIRARALEIQQQLNKSLGAQELKPNVPLRDQLTAKPPDAPKLPEGFTPVDSSALKGFKYDPTTKEFESITQGGQRYIHGDVSPEAVQAFVDAESKGKAWQGIRNDGTLVAKVINGKRVAIKPTSAASAAPEGLPSAPVSVAGGVNGALQEIEGNFPVNPNNPGASTVPKEYALMGKNGPEAAFTVAERGGKLRLKGIQNLNPGTGAGNRALQALTDIADKHGVEMELTASPYGDEATRLDSARLSKWYEMHGFEPEPGSDPAYGYMIRKPQSAGNLTSILQKSLEQALAKGKH